MNTNSINPWNPLICQHAKNASTIWKQWLAYVKLLRPGEFGDLYADGREVLGLIILYQTADEHFRNLGKNKKSGLSVLGESGVQ